METLFLVVDAFLFVLVLLQFRNLSKQNIKIESLESLCHSVSDQLDDFDFTLDDLSDEVYSMKKTKKSNKKGA